MVTIQAAAARDNPCSVAKKTTCQMTMAWPTQPRKWMKGRFQKARVRRACWRKTLLRSLAVAELAGTGGGSASVAPRGRIPRSAGSLWKKNNSENRMVPPTAAIIQKPTCQPVRETSSARAGAVTDAPMPPKDCWMPTAMPSFRLNQAATVVGMLTVKRAWANPSRTL